ncbi:MAG: hypothetical protein ACHQET_03990 [Chitinophagales bacterium]|jgi:galactitol-specific phosphotransferase system IIB component
MKKLFVILVAAGALVACGNGSESSTSSVDSAAKAATDTTRAAVDTASKKVDSAAAATVDSAKKAIKK